MRSKFSIKTRVLPVLILLVMGSQSLAIAQQATAGRQAFMAGNQAFVEQDYTEALAHFQRALAGGLDTMPVHYNLAVCHFKLGHYLEADEAFRQLAHRFPAMRGVAYYNLGLISLRRNDNQTALRHFEQARTDGRDEKVTRLANYQLNRLGAQVAPRSRWTNFLDIRAGYDDNVSLVADLGLPTAPLTDSSFAQVFGLLSREVGTEQRFRVDGSLYSVRYGDAPGFDQNSLWIGGFYVRDIRTTWDLEAGPYASYTTFDGDPFERRVGALLSIGHTFNNRFRLRTEYNHDEVENGEAQFAFIEGSRDRLRVTLHYLGPRARFSVGYEFEDNDRFDPSVSPTRNRLFGRVRYPVNNFWDIHAHLTLRSSRYRDLQPTRDEDLVELTLGATRRLGTWRLLIEIQQGENDANAPGFSYDRTRALVGLTGGF